MAADPNSHCLAALVLRQSSDSVRIGIVPVDVAPGDSVRVDGSKWTVVEIQPAPASVVVKQRLVCTRAPSHRRMSRADDRDLPDGEPLRPPS